MLRIALVTTEDEKRHIIEELALHLALKHSSSRFDADEKSSPLVLRGCQPGKNRPNEEDICAACRVPLLRWTGR
jgi:hypothetical protein